MRNFGKSLAWVFFPVLSQLILATFAFGQGGRGAVAGGVKDQANTPLASALVEIHPTGQRAATDDQGQYRITELSAGDYTVTFSYVGFSPNTLTVTVVAGQTVNLDTSLRVASQTDQVIVTAERVQGEAEAINIERMSDEIVQVLPAKVINSLPNTNVADAVGRLPSVSLERDEGEGKYVQIRGTEPRLSNVTINGVNVPSPEGVVRNIKLDAVPADLVERIEVFKTLAANQDADGIGGTVNLVTKTAIEKPTYSFGGQGGYTPIQGGRTLGGFDGTVGQRFGAQKKLGILFGGTFDRNNRGIDDLEPTQAATTLSGGQNVAYVASEDQRSYSYYRTRYGFAEGIDYTIKPGTNVYLKGLYSDFHDYGDTWVYTPNAGNMIKSVNGSQITFDNAQDCQTINQAADLAAQTDPTVQTNPCSPGSYNYRHYIRRPDQQVFSILAGARHDLSSTLIVYEFAGSRSHNIGGQDFATSNFSGAAASYDANGNLVPGSAGADLALSLSNPLRPKFIAQDSTSLHDTSQYTLADTIYPKYHATQVNYQGAASLARRYSVHGHASVFEMGVKIRDSHTTQNQEDQFFSNFSAPIALSSVLGTYTNPSYYDKSFAIGGVPYGPTSDYNKIIQAASSTQFQSSSDVVTSVTRSANAFFDADERVYAGYLQDVITFGKLRLQGGVRFEGTSTHFLTNQLTANVDSMGNSLVPTISPLRQDSGYVSALPSIQAQYLIWKNTNLRGNFSQGISRPNIGDLVPTTIVDPNASPKSVSTGNPNLKPTKANNYDVLVEHYFQPLGILQAGFFYKQLSDPIYPTAVTIQSGPQTGYLLTQSINGPSAHITGFEAAWEQRLSHLPGLLSGFGVSANYSYTTSQVKFPAGFSNGRTDQPTFQRQAPNNWNAGFTYDKSRLSMRFAVSHNDASIFQYAFQENGTPNDPILGLKGPGGDIYLYAHTQFDIQGSYRLYKGLSFFAYGLNLTNEVFGFYQGSKIYPIQREYYHPTVAFGLRWTSSSE
jgi:TonB-dependent receptor